VLRFIQRIDLNTGEFGMTRGFKVFYDFKQHGLHVNTANVVFEEALYHSPQNARVSVASTFVAVLADSKGKGLRILVDTIAEHRANEEGMVPYFFS
jgi:hypothetical protein